MDKGPWKLCTQCIQVLPIGEFRKLSQSERKPGDPKFSLECESCERRAPWQRTQILVV